jgi:hypothetical protein
MAGSKRGRSGYIDQSGKIVIPLVLPYWGGNSDGEFHDGLLEIGNGKGIYVDHSGRRAFPGRLQRGWDFSEGLAAAMPEKGVLWGYINTHGDFAIRPWLRPSADNYLWPFQDGLALIEEEGKYGYIDRTGKFVIPPRFLLAEPFHEGIARVVIEGPCVYQQILEESPCPDIGTVPHGKSSLRGAPPCKYTFVDKLGNLISNAQFDYAREFSEGLAPVKSGGKWGYIDRTGHLAIPLKYDMATPFSQGLALVSEDKLFGYIDSRGEFRITPRFKYAESFADGLAVVGDERSSYWYINQDGNQLFGRKFVLASPFFKGIAHVKLEGDETQTEIQGSGTFAYINRSGDEVFRYKP